MEMALESAKVGVCVVYAGYGSLHGWGMGWELRMSAGVKLEAVAREVSKAG